MMETQFSRTQSLIGADGLKTLKDSRVLVFGAGGVGGYAIEALARAGVGTIGICDGDTVSITNLNRQILATHQTIGRFKTECASERIKAINPAAAVILYPFFYRLETKQNINLTDYDFIADAIDQISAKIELITAAKATGVPIVSCMGTGNKLDPSQFRIADIMQTHQCPLAKIMRSELKKRNIENLPVVFSPESPAARLSPPASLPFVPPVAGMIMAGYIINKLLENSP